MTLFCVYIYILVSYSFPKHQPATTCRPSVKGEGGPGGYLAVVEVVDEGDEAAHRVPQVQREQRNVPDEHRVKVPRHLQVVAGAQRLWRRSNTHKSSKTVPQVWLVRR